MSQPSTINQQILLGDDYIFIWVEAFLKERTAQNLVKGTVKFYKERLDSFASFLESQEVKYISQITPILIRDFLLLLEERGHNAGGIHSYFRSIKAFLRWYWDEVEPDSRNPINKVKAPKVPVEPIEGISKENFESLLSACPKLAYHGERDRTILMMLLDTGVRATELCNLNLEDVNLMDSSILVRQGKGRKPRYVFIGRKTRKQLRKWISLRGREGNALLLNRYEERIKYSTLREIMRRLSQKAGIEEPSLHDFRRAFCLECMRKGVDLLTLSRLMGHTTLQLLTRYAKQTTNDLQNSYKSILDD